MTDVFLSYSMQDADVAARLSNQLRLAGLSVWRDRDALQGEPLTESLSRGITNSTAFVLLVPREADSSKFLQLEIDTALVRSATGNLLVFPVVLPGRTFTGDVSRFRCIRVESEETFAPVIELVSKAVLTAGMPGPTEARAGARLRVSFLSTLLRTDLAQAPLAASLVLDEISQSVTSDINDVAQQLEVLQSAVEWGRTHLGSDHRSVILLMYRLAELLFKYGHYEESVQLNQVALNTTKNPKDKLEASINLGNALLAMGRSGEAEQCYRAALTVARDLTFPSATGTALVALGTLAQRRNDRTEARTLFEEAIRVTTGLNHPSARINALLGLCELWEEIADDATRKQYAEEALWISQTALSGDHALALRAKAAARVAGIEA